MLRKPLLRMLFSVLVALGFVWGLTRLFVLRYEVGDSYPPYSSLRADPVGTKALATALGELPNVEVRRNFKPLPRLRTTGPVTLVYAGVPHRSFWEAEELQAFNQIVLGGGRAVFTFYPVESSPSSAEERLYTKEERERKQKKNESIRLKEKRKQAQKEKEQKADKSTPAPDQKKEGEDKKSMTPKKDAEEDDGDKLVGFSEVAKRWGVDFGYLPEEKGKAYYRHASLIEPGGLLEPDISWHSALYFRDLKPQWKVLYMCGTMPVIVERKYGNGSIVLVADSFLVSNEALREERLPKLLSRLFSGPSPIIFDEDHNDLHENPGVASLARKYHLYGVIAGLILLAILFVWKNMVRFIPAYENANTADNVVVGKESGEGFVNLLRRSIRPSAIFATCITEWRKTFNGRVRERVRVEEIYAQEEARTSRERNPVETYRTISRAIARKL